MMIQYKLIPLGLTFMATLFLGACSQEEITSDASNGHKESDLIIFNAKGDNVVAGTRAADQGEITYLPKGTRFALRMYYNDQNTSTSTAFTKSDNVFMQVSSSPASIRCIYTDSYADRTDSNNNDDDKTAPKLYWYNRKFHGFVGFFYKNKGTTDKPSLVGTGTTPSNKDSIKVFLCNVIKDKDNNIIYESQENDPMLAVKRQQPTLGDNEANKVNLLFEHQTACVVVNIKADKESVEPKPEGSGSTESGEQAWIKQISLLGTAESVTVYTKMNNDGKIVDEKNKEIEYTIKVGNTTEKRTCNSRPSERIIENLILKHLYSQYESSDDEKKNIKAGYSATASGLAYGRLNGLGIVWQEYRKGTSDAYEGGAIHTINYKFVNEKQEEEPLTLESGKKYIYNVTLRRGTIATVDLEIVDWKDDDAKDYTADGTIGNSTTTSPGKLTYSSEEGITK